MTLYEFIALDEMEQGKAVLKAPQIAERDDGEYNILLYQIDQFYAGDRRGCCLLPPCPRN